MAIGAGHGDRRGHGERERSCPRDACESIAPGARVLAPLQGVRTLLQGSAAGLGAGTGTDVPLVSVGGGSISRRAARASRSSVGACNRPVATIAARIE